MSKRPAFWDSSALVPLCLHESASRKAHSQLRRFLPWCGGGVWSKFIAQSPDSIVLGSRVLGETESPGSSRSLESRLERILPADQVRDLATLLPRLDFSVLQLC